MVRRCPPTKTKQCNHKKKKNPIKIVTTENHNDILSPNPIWNSLLSLEKEISLSDFHEDLIFQILIRLPAPSLHELRRVCKQWLHIISNPYFIHSQLDRARFQLNLIKRFEIWKGYTPSFDITDSETREEQNLKIGCIGEIAISGNGLLLVENNLAIHVSNPATKQLLTLPRCSTFPRHSTSSLERDLRDFCRLGYAPSTREYKVLHFFYQRKEQQCEILTLGSDAWRRVDCRFRDLPLKISEQVLLNGVLHWVVGYDYIMSMNVAEETFDETPVPSCTKQPYSKLLRYQPFYLMEIGGYPSLIRRTSFVQFDVWMLKDFRTKEWMKLYSIGGAEVEDLLVPIASLRNDEVIFQSMELRKNRGPVVSINNLRLGKMVEVRTYPGVLFYWPNMTHIQSLVSWKSKAKAIEVVRKNVRFWW